MRIQALSWQAKAPKQQDSLLITDNKTVRVIQHKGVISNTYEFTDNFLVAVADGIASSPYSGLVSKKLLTLLAEHFKDNTICFQKLQNALNNHFSQEKYQGAGSTLALAYYHLDKNYFEIRHLGDSRVYYFDSKDNKWLKLTDDHTYLNELKQEIRLDDNKEYASIYDVLYHYFCIDNDNQISHFTPKIVPYNQGDYLLLCTDGVFDVLNCKKWLSPTEFELKDWLLSMQKLLQNNGAWDNITLVLVKCE